MIHKLAYVDQTARLGRNVQVGPNAYIGAGVVLGDDCVVHNNATITGGAVCGQRNVFFPQAVIGTDPQDLKYKGGQTALHIGDDNVFREMVTVHRGTEVAGGLTQIGSHNRFLVGTHIAHDCIVGDDCILSNGTQLAGHVCIEDKVTIGGIVGVHHFTTIGTLAFVGGLARITTDVPPFMIVEGNPSRVRGFNEIGMKRWGFTAQQIEGIRQAYLALFSQRAERARMPLSERLAELEARAELDGEVRYLCESVRRSMLQGVYGRQLERLRRDSDADREGFYGKDHDQRERGL